MDARLKPQNRIAEFLWLSAAQATSSKLSDDDRDGLKRRLATGRQRLEAAEALWSSGHAAEGLRLAGQALDATCEILAPFRDALGASEDDEDPGPEDGRFSPRVRELLSAKGLSRQKIDGLETVAKLVRTSELPERDADLTRDQHALFHQVTSATRRIIATLRPSVLPRRGIWKARVARLGSGAVLLAACVVVPYFLLRTPDGITVTTSGDWNDVHTGANVLDDNPRTEWQSPDHHGGWLEIRIQPPVNITTLRILNGHNQQFLDRGMRRARIEVYDDGDLAETINERWPSIEAEPEWRELALGLEEVDRIRIDVTSFHRSGAALAEVQWE